jgi:hypothetical protein
LLTLGALASGPWLAAGCGGRHQHKPVSYDKAISDDTRDPTYHEDEERADVEVRGN